MYKNVTKCHMVNKCSMAEALNFLKLNTFCMTFEVSCCPADHHCNRCCNSVYVVSA